MPASCYRLCLCTIFSSCEVLPSRTLLPYWDPFCIFPYPTCWSFNAASGRTSQIIDSPTILCTLLAQNSWGTIYRTDVHIRQEEQSPQQISLSSPGDLLFHRQQMLNNYLKKWLMSKPEQWITTEIISKWMKEWINSKWINKWIALN